VVTQAMVFVAFGLLPRRSAGETAVVSVNHSFTRDEPHADLIRSG
jgi:hypothetical protein